MQSIGERLEEARKRKGISIREAAEATKIRGEYLHKYEGNQFDIKLPEIYVRGFLRTYANYLKLPADKIINDFNALGLNETKSGRGLNREVYGRMDLSVASAKPEKDPSDPNAQPTQPSETNESVTRNPATFVPKGGNSISIDRSLVIKGVVAVVGIAVVVILIISFVSGRGEKIRATQTTATSAPAESIWLRPSPGEPTLTLIGVAGVQATVQQQETGTVIFRGAIPAGEIRVIPRRGSLRIDTETPEKLHIKIGISEFDLRDPKTNELLKSAIINAPSTK